MPAATTRSWGVLDVAQGVAAARPFLALVVQSTGPQAETATLRIRRLCADTGRLEPVLERAVTVPAGGAAWLEAGEAEGMTVEVAVTAEPRLVPTLLQGVRYLATGETDLLLRYGPEDLTPVGG